jgi:hypothetical protein
VSPSEPLDDFLSLSSALTGFSVAQLQGTGMAATYLDELVGVVGDEWSLALLREGCLALRWRDDVEEQLRLRVMDDADLGPLARNVTVLWYTGGWAQLPAEWRDRHGASRPAIGAHPTGAKAPGFASWVGPPSVGGQP